MTQYTETPTEIDAWFARARKATEDYAGETKAPVIGYAWRHDHGKGSGYFRTDRNARFCDGTGYREMPPGTYGLKKQADKLRRMIARMQKRGVRAELYDYTNLGGENNA